MFFHLDLNVSDQVVMRKEGRQQREMANVVSSLEPEMLHAGTLMTSNKVTPPPNWL